jgi:hypothetical protein
MPDYPPSVLAAAAEAIMSAQNANDGEAERFEARTLARAALDAAVPLLAEAVAAKILEHAESHGPNLGAPASDNVRRTWRRHFRIAAQVASLAFSSRDDQLRMAAEAIKRGDVIVCNPPEVPGWMPWMTRSAGPEVNEP